MVAMDEWEDESCCTLEDGHDGPCVFVCSDCGETGQCVFCNGDAGMDDFTWCDGCGGNGLCTECSGDGYVVQDIGSVRNGM